MTPTPTNNKFKLMTEVLLGVGILEVIFGIGLLLSVVSIPVQAQSNQSVAPATLVAHSTEMPVADAGTGTGIIHLSQVTVAQEQQVRELRSDISNLSFQITLMDPPPSGKVESHHR